MDIILQTLQSFNLYMLKKGREKETWRKNITHPIGLFYVP